MARLRPQAAEIHINAGRAGGALAENLAGLGLPLIFDDEALADLGPLSGVRSALRLAVAAGDDAVMTAPCDMPFFAGRIWCSACWRQVMSG